MIATYLPWLLSAVTLTGMWLAGNQHRAAWLVTLGNQVLWGTWIVATGAWGLLPATLAIAAMAIRNYRKWAAR